MLFPILSGCTQSPSLMSETWPMSITQLFPPEMASSSWFHMTSMLDSWTLTLLRDAYREELLARDIYTEIMKQYPSFWEIASIIRSETQHMAKIGEILDKYGVNRPTEYGIYENTYRTLMGLIEQGYTGAIEVGIRIETGDIDHLLAAYKQITDPYIRRVFENIGGWSFNHLRAFLREARAIQYRSSLNTTDYLTPEEVDFMGPLHYKMTALLIANGLPVSENGGGMWWWNGKQGGRWPNE